MFTSILIARFGGVLSKFLSLLILFTILWWYWNGIKDCNVMNNWATVKDYVDGEEETEAFNEGGSDLLYLNTFS